MAARHLRERVQFDHRHPSCRHLPAVPVDQRAVQPRFLQRAVHGWHLVQGDHGRLLVRLVTGGGCARPGSPRQPQKFALWSVYNVGIGTLIPAATVTSGTLTAGQWNYVPLATPIPLSIGACYNACTGFSGSFPDTQNQFGTRRTVQRRNRQRAAVGVLRPVRDTACAFLHVSGRIQRRRVRPRGAHAVQRQSVRQPVDGPPGRHHRRRLGLPTGCGPTIPPCRVLLAGVRRVTPWRPSSS